MCDNQQVFKTPSTNIAIAMNELNKLPKSLALDTVKAYLKAVTVQVNERRTPAPSVSTTRSHRQRGSWQWGGPYLYQGHDGNYEAHREASMMLIKGANATNKAGVAQVMEVSVWQTTVVVVVDNAVPTKKWSNLEVTSVIILAPTWI
jgi:hypothetical protein